MKKFMVLVMMAVTTAATSAKEDPWFRGNKSVKCGPFMEIVQIVTGEPFREQPLWIAQSGEDASQFVLFRNPHTSTWTLVQYGRETGCVLGMGQSDKIYSINN